MAEIEEGLFCTSMDAITKGIDEQKTNAFNVGSSVYQPDSHLGHWSSLEEPMKPVL